MSKQPGNSKYVRKMNRMEVLNIIKEQEPVSRRELAVYTGLTPPAITGIVRELMELGIVAEVGLGKSEGGRKPVKLQFNREAGYVLGVEVTRLETCIGIADLKNHPKDLRWVEIDMTEPQSGVARLVDVLRERMGQSEFAGKRFLGLGIAFPGLVNAKAGTVKRSVNLGPEWARFPLKRVLESELALTAIVENNSNASALAERWFGGGTDSTDLVYVNWGEGISAGVILEDRIIQGFQGHAGEIGHIVMNDGGPVCNCGNQGCLEAYCGSPALVREANRMVQDCPEQDRLRVILSQKRGIEIDDVLTAATDKTSVAHTFIRGVGALVGRALADAVNLYNPESVFIGGKVGSVLPVYRDVIEQQIRSHAFPEIARSTRIRQSMLGLEAGAVGACALALRNVFRSSESILIDEP